VVVESQLELREQNAWVHLFSAAPERVEFGRQHARQRSPDTSSLILQVLWGLTEEETMPYTMENFRRDFASHFSDLTPEERRYALMRLSPEQRREALQTMTPAERVEGLTPGELIQGLSPEQLEQLRQALSTGQTPDQPRRRRRR
jgi:hypothetical protein